LSSNKKWIVLLIWGKESLIKFELEQKYWQTEYWGDQIYNKIRVSVLFVCCIDRIKKINKGRGDEGHLPGYKLNVIDGINPSIVLYVKVTCHCIFCLYIYIYNSFLFHCNSLRCLSMISFNYFLFVVIKSLIDEILNRSLH